MPDRLASPAAVRPSHFAAERIGLHYRALALLGILLHVLLPPRLLQLLLPLLLLLAALLLVPQPAVRHSRAPATLFGTEP